MLKLVVNNPWGKIERLQAEYAEAVLFATDAIMDAQEAFDELMAAIHEQDHDELIEKLTTVGRYAVPCND